MAGDELREQFGKCVCCRIVCPPWDCEQTVLPEQMSDEAAFVDKPNKFLLCCLPMPFPCMGLCCIAPWLSLSIHSVDAEGHLKITHHSMCGESTAEEYDDIVGVNYINQYVTSQGICKRKIGGVFSDVSEAKDAVNEFLQERREETGASLDDRGHGQQIELRSMGAQQPHQGWHQSPIMQVAGAHGGAMHIHAQHPQAHPGAAVHPGLQAPPQGVMFPPPQQGVMQSQMQNMMFVAGHQHQGMAQQQQYPYPVPNMQPSYGGYPPQQWPQYESGYASGPGDTRQDRGPPAGNGDETYQSQTRSAYSPA
eukprot:gb/GECG01016804.1/.p1 GENE.gb/GECG01016804.1/~~gb/GECG01016804.1/.p1  ORF type:complete len:308 (+),score=31.82 gb/GECG01016804.1/:1-924(+)